MPKDEIVRQALRKFKELAKSRQPEFQLPSDSQIESILGMGNRGDDG